jgi:hypothetical protein
MAVVFTPTRTFSTADQATFIEFCTATVTGTYTTAGFVWNPFTIFGGKGSSPLPSSNVLSVDFYSPLGFTYRTSVVGNVATTVVFNGTTQLANAAAMPDATISFTIIKRKI